MKLATLLLVLFSLVALTSSVVISLEESEAGANDYRYFYFTVPEFDGGFTKPFFTLVDGSLSRPYGALGALTCPGGTSGVAIYSDIDADDLKEWSCLSINELPFANDVDPTGPLNPPICAGTAASGIPALWNNTNSEWFCGERNQILTLASRIDDTTCATGDFLTYDGELEEIRCINPQEISEEDTLQARDVEHEARVDIEDDKKWHSVASSIAVSDDASNSRSWHQFKWTPTINYDLTVQFSNQPSPPIPIPFEVELLAVTYASFLVNGYNFQILPPSAGESITGVVTKLSTSLAETVVTSSHLVTSTSATSGQVTFPLVGVPESTAVPGEIFVVGFQDRSWSRIDFPDLHVFTVTLWMQTNTAFTDFFFVEK